MGSLERIRFEIKENCRKFFKWLVGLNFFIFLTGIILVAFMANPQVEIDGVMKNAWKDQDAFRIYTYMVISKLVIGTGMCYLGFKSIVSNQVFGLIGFVILGVIFNSSITYLYLMVSIPALQNFTATKRANKMVFDLNIVIALIFIILHCLIIFLYIYLYPLTMQKLEWEQF